PMAVGMNNHQGSKATADLQLMKNVARSLKKRNKFFLDSFTNPESRGFITMRRFGVKTELRQVFLDHFEDTLYIQKQLDSLVQLSHSMDVAIGIGHVKPITLDILKKEIPRLKADGYNFVPLSQIVR
ncbi:divergent polysaccharide deacetylase family protein, partial [Candidatus Marinimicrobia bacterium]|nr:divergent polysaccharide deacetylase family protein [Candidatus Neomarinimicrobiota bacterium]